MIDALGTLAGFALGLLAGRVIFDAAITYLHAQRKDRP